MSQVEYYTAERRNWWERLFGGLVSKPEDSLSYQLPSDSLLNVGWTGAHSVADVPENVKAQIREEAVLTTFNRLEASLRLLLYATTPDRQPPTAEDCHQILNVWRYELEHQVNLTPDTYCGAVQRYEPEMETSYIIDGRCQSGSLLRIRVPCWRMNERVVVRGEAELLDNPQASSAASKSEAFSSGKEIAVEAMPAVESAPAPVQLAEAVAKTPKSVEAQAEELKTTLDSMELVDAASEGSQQALDNEGWEALVARAQADLHAREARGEGPDAVPSGQP